MSSRMSQDWIAVRGARVHNLRNIDVDIPRDRLVVITGLSGSGKSSLAFDTIYAEGQRRYVESLSAYARQFLEQMEKPDVDLIDGLSPAIAIEQKTTASNPRSTVGTVTEIYDYLRLLFANVGVPHCHNCGQEIASQSLERILDLVMLYPPDERINVLAPMVRGRKGEFKKELAGLRAKGFSRVRVDGQLRSLDETITLDRRPQPHHRRAGRSADRQVRARASPHRVDRRRPRPRRRHRHHQHARRRRSAVLAAARLHQLRVERARDVAARLLVQLAARRLPDLPGAGRDLRLRSAARRSRRLEVARRRRHRDLAAGDKALVATALERLSEHFGISLTTPFRKLPKKQRDILLYGPGRRHAEGEAPAKPAPAAPKPALRAARAIPSARASRASCPNLRRRFEAGSWSERELLEPYRALRTCPDCHGDRLRPESRAVQVKGRSVAEYVSLPITEALRVFEGFQFSERENLIAGRLLREIRDRLKFLDDVGVGYLTLGRSAATLSGGEGQRIRLATQIGANLTGVLYVLDEPSIGLHQRDNRRLLATLCRLRDQGNSVIVVEHDEETIRTADYLVDLGPGAGEHGGRLMFQGRPEELLRRQAAGFGQPRMPRGPGAASESDVHRLRPDPAA